MERLLRNPYSPVIAVIGVFLLATFIVYPALYVRYGINEKEKQPEHWGEATYFSVVTITTTGYGDIQPDGAGRVIACAEMLTGVGVISIVFSLAVMWVGVKLSEASPRSKTPDT